MKINTVMLNINYREIDHPAAARAKHGDTIHEEIRETLRSQQPPFFFAMIYAYQQTQIPTFAYIYPDSVLHPVRIRCHILQPDKYTNYPNFHATCVVPVNFATHIQISANVLGCIHSLLTMSTFLL